MDGTADRTVNDQLRRHYEIERELAGRLREASKAERRLLYTEVYEELSRRVNLAGNREAQRAQVGLLLEFVDPFLQDHFGEVLNLLVDGGAYLVVTPNRIYLPHDISRGFSDRAEGLHLCECTHHDLARELRRAGFTKVGVVGRLGAPASSGRLGVIGAVERLLDGLPGRWRSAILSKAPRQAPFRPLERVKLVGFKAGGSDGRP